MEILNDFSTSVKKALSEIDYNYDNLDGLVICGTHSPHDVEMMIDKIRIARETGRPFLGICFGHQLAAIEYARNVLGISNATSEEFGQGTFIVKKLPYLNVGLENGESYWNNYSVVEWFYKVWEKPYNFVTTQSHPEYQSMIDKPHIVLQEFLKACQQKKKK